MTTPTHELPVRVYYEDTDHTGVVYHANYLKFCERAREHVVGVEELVRLLEEDGVGFVVTSAKMKFVKSARFGDRLVVRTRVSVESEYRLAFHQDIHFEKDDEFCVRAVLDLCCVNRAGELIPLPDGVAERFGGVD